MSTQYAAHLILAVRFRDGVRDRFPCFENVVLVSAADDEEALRAARRYGEDEAARGGDDFTWDGRPAYWEFVGVRKLIECRTPGGADDRVGPGTELTYSQLAVASEEDLRRLADGEPVPLTYEE